MAAKVNVRRRNGTWCVDFPYLDQNGNRHRFKRSTGPQTTRKEALTLGRKWKRQADSLGYVPEFEQPSRQQFFEKEQKEPAYPFSGFADHWLETYAKPRNKPSEIIGKKGYLKNHLVPFFKHKDISLINREDVERLIAKKIKGGLSPKTVNNILACLRKLFNCALDWDYIEKNPMNGVKKLREPPREFDFYTEEETRAFLDVMKKYEPGWYAFFLTAFLTGMRLGEICGLKWEDIDFVSKKIIVRRSYVRKQFVTPKSGRSREVPLHPKLEAALKEHRHLKGDMIFSREDGTPVRQDHVRPVQKRLTRLAGLRRIKFHEIRHSFASQLVMNGVPLKAVQELLGHADMTMTLRYSHLAPSVHYDAIGTLMSGNGHKNGPKFGPTGQNEVQLEVIGRKEKAQNPKGFQALKSGSGERI